MCGQWFLLGKEIDHRLKIYIRVNSSMDRVLYRIILGKSFILLYFLFLSIFSPDVLKHFFWGTWVVLGIFYSWPTRGKIIQESVSTNFSEFRFLDSFEKTILALVLIYFVFTIPQFPKFENIDVIKLMLDPNEKISNLYWNFMNINYFPFAKFPALFKLANYLHFYVIGIGMYLVSFYSLLRFFVSRRLSILGSFALISSWSLSKFLSENLSFAVVNSFPLLWIWGSLWVSRSATYRTGLFIGLLSFYGATLNYFYALLFPFQFAILIYTFRDKTFWYWRQFFRYALLGYILTTFIIINNFDYLLNFKVMSLATFWGNFQTIINRKGFFLLSYFGLFLLFYKLYFDDNKIMHSFKIEPERIKELLLSFLIYTIIGLFLESFIYQNFGLLWFVALLSLIPLELIFQSISKLRSRRNIIYACYILICILDSHFEGRFKVFYAYFK